MLKRSQPTNGDDPYEYASDDEEAAPVSQRSTRSRQTEPETNGKTNGDAHEATTQLPEETMEIEEETGTITDERYKNVSLLYNIGRDKTFF